MNTRELRWKLGRAIIGSELRRPPGFQIGAMGRAYIWVPPGEEHLIRVTGMQTMYQSRYASGRFWNTTPGGVLVAERPVDWWAGSDSERGPSIDFDEVYELLRSPEGEGHALAYVGQRPNAYVNLGLHFVLDRIFNLNTPNTAITHSGITDDVQTVTAATLLLNPATGGVNLNIKTLGTGVGATATSRTAETVTGGAGWTQADGDFVIVKNGWLNTSTDAGDDTVPTVQGIMNIIGGTGGASPYNEPFTIDLTSPSAFNLTLNQEHTAQAT